MADESTTPAVAPDAAATAAQAAHAPRVEAPSADGSGELAALKARLAEFERQDAERTSAAEAARAKAKEEATALERLQMEKEDLQKALSARSEADKARLEGLAKKQPAHIRAALDAMPVDKALAWLDKHGGAQEPLGTTRSPRPSTSSTPISREEAENKLIAKMNAEKVFNLRTAAKRWPQLWSAAHPAAEG